MRTPRVTAAVLLLLMASACAERVPGRDTPPLQGTPAGETRYQASVTVLQDREKPAQMCWNIATSLPPQCGDVPITNWSWDDVGGEERMSGVIWGQYHLIGTYDGEAFTVLETGSPQSPPASSEDEIATPCPEPDGGWQTTDPSRATEAHLETISSSIREEPDHAGLWIDYLGDPPAEESSNAGAFVLTVAFTADIERHRSEISEVWDGPLCVVEFERTLSDLTRIQSEIGDGSELGLHLLNSSVSETRNRVEATVVLADAADQAALDARYGPGAVVLEAALQPVD